MPRRKQSSESRTEKNNRARKSLQASAGENATNFSFDDILSQHSQVSEISRMGHLFKNSQNSVHCQPSCTCQANDWESDAIKAEPEPVALDTKR